MLPAAHRLVHADSFRAATRRGRRAGSQTVVTHLLPGTAGEDLAVSGVPASGVRVGFVVSKAVGGAVVRNRVKRRLRHAMADRLAALPDPSVLVVRANPAAAGASYDALGRDLDRCLSRVRSQAEARGVRSRP